MSQRERHARWLAASVLAAVFLGFALAAWALWAEVVVLRGAP